MTAPNQRHGVPRYLDSTPFSTRRGHFLDSTQKVFYGPGQPPDSGHQGGVGADGIHVTKEYTPPVDWPAAGTLLRVPQVVFLSRKIFRGLGPVNVVESYWTDFYSSIRGSSWENVVDDVVVCSGTVRDPSDVLWSTFSTSGILNVDPDVEKMEDTRVAAMFDEVVTRISGLRHGRTYVKHWSDWDIRDDRDGSGFAMDNTMDHMLAPPLAEDSWFGTDFLHVYCGLPVAHTSSRGFVPVVGFTAVATPSGNSWYASSLARQGAGADRFRRYAAWVYTNRIDGEGVDWTSEDISAMTTAILDHYPGISTARYDSYVYHVGDTSTCDPTFTFTPFSDPRANPYVALPYSATLAIDVGILDSDATAALSARNDAEEAAGEFLRTTCLAATAAGIDIEFKGASSALTADALVRLIADHFGFDPDTGLDL